MIYETEQDWYHTLLNFFEDYYPLEKAQVIAFDTLLVLMKDKNTIEIVHGDTLHCDGLIYTISEVLNFKNINITVTDKTIKLVNDEVKETFRDITRSNGEETISLLCNNIPLVKMRAKLLDSTINRKQVKIYLNKYTLITKERGGEIAIKFTI